MAWRCRTMRPANSTNTGMRQRRARRSTGPGPFAFLAFDRKHAAQTLFEQISTVEPGVGLGDPGQLGGLAVGEILGGFQQRIAGALELARPLMTRTRSGVLTGPATAPFSLAARQCPRIIPGSAPLDIQQRLGRPGHHMEAIGTADRTWAPLSHHVADPVRGIGRYMGDLAAPLDAQGVEEPPQGGVSRPAAAYTSRPLS